MAQLVLNYIALELRTQRQPVIKNLELALLALAMVGTAAAVVFLAHLWIVGD